MYDLVCYMKDTGRYDLSTEYDEKIIIYKLYYIVFTTTRSDSGSIVFSCRLNMELRNFD